MVMDNPSVTIGSQLYHIKFVFAADYKVHILFIGTCMCICTYYTFAHTYICTYTLGNILTNSLHLQFLLLLMGMNKASSTYACLWCTASSEERLPYLVND